MKVVKNMTDALQGTLRIFIFVLATGGVAFSQAGNGGISGLVTDPSGAVVPGATVQVKSESTGVVLSKTTTGAGAYFFTALTPAAYDVTVSRNGFSTAVHNDVVVTVDQTTTVNVILPLGKTTQTVTVTGTSPLADTSNSTVGQLIGAEQINRVPLLTRDVYQLVQLSAGVLPTNGTPNASDTPSIFGERPGADVSGYTINGALPGSIQYLVDGSPISIGENNLGADIPAMQMPLDDIQEYRVETQNTPATYQSSGAGAISLVTKSGTNKFHGDAFVYIRPDSLAANDYFNKQIQAASGMPNTPNGYHRYQEGGSIGGPIMHNKLFFFADYEATQQDSIQTGFYTVPTPAERMGNFSADGFTIYNPLVPDLPDGTRQPFPGNKIPTPDINAIARNYNPHFPLPNSAGTGPYHINNYGASGLDPNDAQKFDIRIDGYRGAKQHIYGRFSFARLLLASADLYGASNIYEPDFYHIVTNERNFLLADDISLTQNTLLQLRYSFTRHYENQTGDPRQVGFDMTTLGFPASLAAQQVYKDIPFIYFGDVTAPLGSNPYTTFQYVSENPFDIIASLSTIKGKHQLEGGVEIEKRFMNEGQPVSPSGAYTFDNTATSSTTFAGDGSDYASFLIGMGSYPGGQVYPNFSKDIFGAQANPYYAAYIQDDWKARSNLTVNLGLRWDIFGGRTERFNRLEYFDPTVNYTVNGVPLTGGEQFAGVDGHGRSPFTTNLKDFGPRVSFAWQPSTQFVIQGGSGIYYGPSTQTVANAALNSDGFTSFTTWNATAYNADGNTVPVNFLNNPFPDGVVQPTGSSLGSATNLGNELSTELHSQRTPTTYDFNLGTQTEFSHGIVLAIAYVGSRGRFLPFGGVDLNQLSLQTIGQYGNALNNQVPNKWLNVYPVGTPYAGSPTVPQSVALEPYPQFTCGGADCGVEVFAYPAGTSEYDSLQTKLEKRAGPITTLAAFTWGKLLTNDSDPPLSFIGFHAGAPQDWRNLNLEHSLSPQDVSHQFSWETSFDLPFGRGRRMDLHGWANQAFGGWTLNTIVYLSSGVPVAAPTTGTDPFFNQRVNQICDPGKGAAHTPAQWFNYSCFAQPASEFVAGTAPAYLSHVRTNGAHDLDASVFKNFSLGGNRVLRFEFAAYNVTNSVQFGYPSVYWNPSPSPATLATFGQITSDSNLPRQIQVASRFIF